MEADSVLIHSATPIHREENYVLSSVHQNSRPYLQHPHKMPRVTPAQKVQADAVVELARVFSGPKHGLGQV